MKQGGKTSVWSINSIKKTPYLSPLEHMPLLKLLLVLIFVHQDEIDLPLAIVEE